MTNKTGFVTQEQLEIFATRVAEDIRELKDRLCRDVEINVASREHTIIDDLKSQLEKSLKENQSLKKQLEALVMVIADEDKREDFPYVGDPRPKILPKEFIMPEINKDDITQPRFRPYAEDSAQQKDTSVKVQIPYENRYNDED